MMTRSVAPNVPLRSPASNPMTSPLASCLVVAIWLAACTPPVLVAPSTAEPTEFPTPGNTQEESTPRLTPAQALATIRAPEGFRTSLFAAEPDVQQPIALAFDPRGRLWVAENYTYAEASVNFDRSLRDRIVVLEDQDGDGSADVRKVFWDRAQLLTSIEIGFGGVWALCPPNLYFLPDHDGDDVPDGEPIVMLDGWDDSSARHNFVNGLRWGPDGWLYGRNGILATSHVGLPGTPAEQRTPLNCAIWRFHPVRKTFEVVCHGTTNPWGSDWDEHGQLFFINTVIGHLWHVVPGAHYRRMYGEDLNPHVFELIEQTADHFHWDIAQEDWTSQRKIGVSAGTDRAGGGHAHSGLMIYLGDNWPEEYRGELFTLNLHGRRINRDHLERDGATYTGRHRPDFLSVGDPWYRGLDLAYGPDGGVYVLDWSDIGECHENDGVHRTSGRIYKIVWGAATPDRSPPEHGNLATMSADQLAELQTHANDWYVRQARRLLQERAAAGDNLESARRILQARLAQPGDVARQLRSLWALHGTGGLSGDELCGLLDDPSEHVRLWAVQLLAEPTEIAPQAVSALQRLSERETSGLVLTYLAAALQRLPAAARWALADNLVRHGELAEDRVFPLMVWYGLESVVPQDQARAVQLIERSRLPKVSRYLARRITLDMDRQPAGANALARLLASSEHVAQRRAVLTGMAEALRGWQKVAAPEGWPAVTSAIGSSSDPAPLELVRELSLVFGDGRAADTLRAIAADGQQPIPARRRAIRSLADARISGLHDLLVPLLTDRDLGDEAVRGLATSNAPGTAELLVEKYGSLYRPAKNTALEVLASRPASARLLLDAVANHAMPRADITPFLLRQMQLLGPEDIPARVAELWPELRLIATDKLAQIAAYRAQLPPEQLAQADLPNGRRLFDQACGKCHKLFGSGGNIGPELTGAQRTNLNYLLENVVDPSAVVPVTFRMSVLVLDDGRVLNGVVTQQSDRTLSLQTPTELLVLDRKSVEEIRPSLLSLMPEGQLATLTQEQIRDLIAYLMAPQQVGLDDQDSSAPQPIRQD